MNLRWVIIFALLILSASNIALGLPETTAVAEVHPAPVGYSYYFPNTTIPQIVGVRIHGDFQPLRADVTKSNTLIYTSPAIDYLISPSRTIKLHRIFASKFGGYVVNTGKKAYVVYSEGVPVMSDYRIFTSYSQVKSGGRDVLVVTKREVDFSHRAIRVLFVSSPSSTIILRSKNFSIETTLPDLLSVTDACIQWFDSETAKKLGWKGGVVLSPACLQKAEVIRKVVHNGVAYGVILRANSKYGVVHYLIFTEPNFGILEDLGLLRRVNEKQSKLNYHIIELEKTTPLEGKHFYLTNAKMNVNFLKELQIINATDMSEIVKGTTTASIPDKAEIVFSLLWKYRPIKGEAKLNAGEFVLYRYSGKYYVVHGALDWLDFNSLPAIKAPAYKELAHPIIITYPKPFLVVSANGDVFYGTRVEIDYDYYKKNSIFVVSTLTIYPIKCNPTSLFLSPYFLISLLSVGFLAMMILTMRQTPTPETIKVIIDLPITKPAKITPLKAIYEIARNHIENFGVCPTDEEIALLYRKLPPLKYKLTSAEPQIISPFETNPKTEKILRKLVQVTLPAFWGLKRVGKNYGYLYTPFAEQFLYLYVYKQENETDPADILINALRTASRTFIHTHYVKRPLGLVIITDKEMFPKLKNELRTLEDLSHASGVAGYNVSGYLSVREHAIRDINVEKLQEFTSKFIPRIFIITEENIPELIEYLGEAFASLATTYDKILRKQRTPEF